MGGQVKMYLCLVAFIGIVHALPTENSLHLDLTDDETDNTITEENGKELFITQPKLDKNVAEVSATPLKTKLSKTTKKDKTKVEKSVNELYPYAVRFGTTCGGTIISPTWVITAAHCSIGDFGWYVLVKTNNTKLKTGPLVGVKRRVVHPLFEVGPYWLNARDYNLKQIRAEYDFLLAELDEPLPLDGINLRAAKLNKTYELVPNMDVSFAGYGADKHGGKMNSEMHIRKFQLQTDKECARLQEYNSLDMICAKGTPPNFDTACNGDSGSGLVDENEVLLGVTSWVEDDAVRCFPGALVYFAKIAAVREWIYEVTKI